VHLERSNALDLGVGHWKLEPESRLNGSRTTLKVAPADPVMAAVLFPRRRRG